MRQLLAVIIAWNRPHFLRQTLDSLFTQTVGTNTSVMVVDNGSNAETVALIEHEPRLKAFRLLGSNLGINGALEAMVTDETLDEYEYILVSDADMQYRSPLQGAVDLLIANPAIGAVSYQHSPEHPVTGRLSFAGRIWPLKTSERGCALMLRMTDYRQLRPLPIENLKDFDWWVVRDAPRSLQQRGLSIAVLPGGAWHLGWRAGDSTWQPGTIPEFWELQPEK